MKLRYYFLLLSLLIVGLFALLMRLTFNVHPTIFYVAEGMLVVVLIFLVVFYRKVIRPIDTLTGGMELLRDQDMSTTLAPSGQKETDEIVKTFNALITRLRNEHLRLDEQNSFLNLLIDASPMGVILCDLSGNVKSMNPAAQKMLTPAISEAMKTLPLGEDTTLRLSNSQIYHLSHLSFLDRGYQHPFFLIESLTSEVMKAEKVAYEKVIRMIAHEVNNSVAGIIGSLTGDKAERLTALSAFVTRFAEVVKIPQPQLQLCDLSEEVDACRPFLENLCTQANVKIDFNLTDEAIPVHLDTVLFQQVLINIVKNAVESIGERLKVGNSTSEMNEGQVTVTTSIPSKLVITDNGHGIPSSVATHLFTPFFSTKPQGQGLGLLLIRDILTSHHCTFSLLTDPEDHLTRFTILFPK